MNETPESKWYGVRTLNRWLDTPTGKETYEERVTIWMANSGEEALALAAEEAIAYSEINGLEDLGFAQAFWMSTSPAQGSEVFSLLRDSDLQLDDYLNAYSDTGAERQQKID